MRDIQKKKETCAARERTSRNHAHLSHNYAKSLRATRPAKHRDKNLGVSDSIKSLGNVRKRETFPQRQRGAVVCVWVREREREVR